MRLVFLSLLLGACGPATATILPTSDLPDTDTGSDSDSDSGTETDSETETEPPKTVQAWAGVRNFDFGRCEEAIDESGVRLASGDVFDACGDCDYVFEVEMQQDSVCGVELQNPAWRGVSIRGDEVTVYFINQGQRGNWEAEARAMGRSQRQDEGIVFEYEYEGDAGWNREYTVEAFTLLVEE